ncbi:MAG: membrane dipeptidase [Clostridia bacterium]|nr:membrane dipeptidase [Clostridia bacterium]
MFIADTHSDTLFNLARGQKITEVDITPERLITGGVTLQVFAMWSGPKGPGGDYAALAEAEYAARQQFIDAGVPQVDDPSEAVAGKPHYMLSLEGCEVFQDGLDKVAFWRERGVRMGAPVWNNENALATPAKKNPDDGLTDYGVKVVKEMQKQGIAVDVSHLNERGFYDLFLKGDKAPMASHSCCRALCDHFRNLTDDQIRLMIRDGGFIGVNFYPAFLSADKTATTRTLAQHIDHICQLGGADIVGFGSDFDGIERYPEDLRHPGQMGNLLAALRDYGYDGAALEKIAGGNLLGYYRRIK